MSNMARGHILVVFMRRFVCVCVCPCVFIFRVILISANSSLLADDL